MKNHRRLARWTAITVFACIALSVGITAVRAQPSFVVATGAEKGSTYTQMFTELAAACTPGEVGVQLKPQYTTGSIQNLELLTGNKVHGVFVQSDLLFSMRESDAGKVSSVKTIVALHPEELHFIARADTKKEGGYFGGRIGGKDVTFTTLTDLRDRPVGAVGGSVFSGRTVSQFSGVGFQVVEFANNDALKAALLDGKVDAILVVGGAPHALVGSLDTRFRLLPVPPNVAAALKDVYAPATLTYSNLNQSGVPSISTQAIFATRTFESPAVKTAISKLRTCFTAQLPNIKDALGTHAKWQAVKAGDMGKWPAY